MFKTILVDFYAQHNLRPYVLHQLITDSQTLTSKIFFSPHEIWLIHHGYACGGMTPSHHSGYEWWWDQFSGDISRFWEGEAKKLTNRKKNYWGSTHIFEPARIHQFLTKIDRISNEKQSIFFNTGSNTISIPALTHHCQHELALGKGGGGHTPNLPPLKWRRSGLADLTARKFDGDKFIRAEKNVSDHNFCFSGYQICCDRYDVFFFRFFTQQQFPGELIFKSYGPMTFL